VHGAFEAMIAGKLNATIDATPLLGRSSSRWPSKSSTATGSQWVPSKEGIYYPDNAKEILPARKY